VGAQIIMDGMESGLEHGRFLHQELPQRIRVGKLGQTGEILEHAVRAKQRLELDGVQAEDHRVHHGEEALGDAEVVVPFWYVQSRVEERPHTQLLQESMQKVHAAEVRQVPGGKRDFNVSRARSRHIIEPN